MPRCNDTTRLALACAALFLAGVGLRGQAARPEPELQAALARLKSFYEARVREAGIVGTGIMVVQDGRLVFQDSYGMARLEPKQPVDEDTIFHWASITKTFTAIGILQLR